MNENNEATVSYELSNDKYNCNSIIAWGASDLSSNLNGPTFISWRDSGQ